MIKPLRKKHLQIWSLWALILPLGMIAALIARKPVVNDAFGQVQNGKALPVVIAEKRLGQNLLQLRGTGPGAVQQLLWINREPLNVASATIYLSGLPLTPSKGGGTASVRGQLQQEANKNSGSQQNEDKGIYIGRIEIRGNYVFGLPPQKEYHFLVYDFIHQQIISRISFSEHDVAGRKETSQSSPTPNTKL